MFENGPIPTKIVGHGIRGSRPTLRVQPENLAAAPAARENPPHVMYKNQLKSRTFLVC